MTFHPKGWSSWIPRDPSLRKPNHYAGMLRVAWENRDQIPYAWRVLNHGVCDGCALGTAGMKDWTIDGMHLCMVRLELMRLNTAPALDPGRLADVSSLTSLSSAELRDLGRLPEPMIRHRGERGFRIVSWEEAYAAAAERIRATDPQRFAVYLTSRGILNEHYYAAQKAARVMGTNHVDNSARLCHAASTAAMKAALGYGASTCTYRDWLRERPDRVLRLEQSQQPARDHQVPVLCPAATGRGSPSSIRIASRGCESYWVPSVAESAVFGTRIADDWFDVDTGGDLAFLTGVFRVLVEEGWVDAASCAAPRPDSSKPRAARRRSLGSSSSASSGATRCGHAALRRDAARSAPTASSSGRWASRSTPTASTTVRALVNVGARARLGRPRARGLVPIRGHSGVQGGAEVGCVPTLDDAQRARFEQTWGFPLPRSPV